MSESEDVHLGWVMADPARVRAARGSILLKVAGEPIYAYHGGSRRVRHG